MNLKFIHVGHHRCGSTFLQKRLFPRLVNLTAVTYYSNFGIQDEIDYLILCSNAFYEPERITGPLRAKLAPLGDCCMSYEGLSGLNEGLQTCYQLDYIPRRLHDVFGPTQILFVIREQRGHLISRYRTRVRIGELTRFEPWVRAWYRDHKLDFLKYSGVLNAYAGVFGLENVHVVLFEELFDRDRVAGVLRDMGVDPAGIESVAFDEPENQSDTGPVLHATRLVNRLFGSKVTHSGSVGRSPNLRVHNFWRYRGAPFFNRLSSRLGATPPHYHFEGLDEILFALCHEDNRKVSATIGRDLTETGYL